MKTLTKTGQQCLAAAVVVLVLGGVARSAEGKGEKPGRAFHKEQRKRAKAHYEQQKKENKSFRKSQKGSDASIQEKLSASKSHRQTQVGENETFHGEQHSRLVAFVKERMAEKDVPADKQKRILASIEAVHDKMVAHHETQHQENMNVLDKLIQKDDLSKEEVKTTLKEHLKQQHEENKAFREKMREERRAKRKAFRENRGGRKKGKDVEAEK